jgi:hypothetical protein
MDRYLSLVLSFSSTSKWSLSLLLSVREEFTSKIPGCGAPCFGPKRTWKGVRQHRYGLGNRHCESRADASQKVYRRWRKSPRLPDVHSRSSRISWLPFVVTEVRRFIQLLKGSSCHP